MPRKDFSSRCRCCESQVQASPPLQTLKPPSKLQGATGVNRVDLKVFGKGATFTAKAFGLRAVGVAIEEIGKEFASGVSSDERIIYRLRNVPFAPAKYDYLLTSENIDDISRIDILSIQDFQRAKGTLRKKPKAGTGIEVTIEHARGMDPSGVAKWLADTHDLYEFCQSSGFQFILSSGATSHLEAVSGQSLDAVLKLIGIDPQKHWRSMDRWLESRLDRRVQTC